MRHGQSENNASAESIGSPRGRVSDPSLTAHGVAQARALAAALATRGGDGEGPRVQALVTSPMTRAVQTASELADALLLPVDLCPWAFESGGPYEEDARAGGRRTVPGVEVSRLVASYPRVRAPGVAQRWWPASYEGDHDARMARAARLLAWLEARYDPEGGLVAVVTHQDFAQYVVAAHLGLSARPAACLRLAHTGTTLLITPSERSAEAQVVWANRIDHLRPDDVTGLGG